MSQHIPFYKNKSFYLKSIKVTLHTVKWLLIAGLISCFLVGGVAVGYVTAIVKDDPIRSKQFIVEKINENAITGFIHFRDDTLVGQLRSEEDRRLVEMADIPQHVKEAFLAIEDNNFYEHIGIDFKGVFRALKQQVFHEDVQTGGSTITQQLARRVFLSLERSVDRKAKELFLSLRLERLMSKDEIFLAYLTKIHFGNASNGYNVYGIKAAAKGIFDVEDLNQLNIAQAAYLAGLPQLPSNYSAFTSRGDFDAGGFKRATARKELVLKRMLEEGKITQQQYDEAIQFDLKASLAESKKKAYTTYPYLMLEAERTAAEILLRKSNPNADKLKPVQYNEELKVSSDLLLRGGYHIYTTIDKDIYDEMKSIAEDDNNFTPDDPVKGIEQIGAIMLDNNGSILGMIEGRDFNVEQMNHATQALRQPGSTMKPIAAFLPALEVGALQPATIIDDVPLILEDGVKGYHLPENWDEDFHGLVTARTALNWSYNIPAIKLFLHKVGIHEAWEFARKLGISTLTKEDAYAQTGVIGGLTQGVSVKELTGAYSSIPNKGVFNKPFLIRKITDSSGNVIYEHELKPTSVYSEETAYLMTDMLRTVVTSGTATDLMSSYKHHKNVPIVGKTGSTQDDADAWFIGYSPDITVGVWAGYESPKHKLNKKGCPPAGCGTQRAKNIYAKIMNAAVGKNPELFPTSQFTKPDNIIQMEVSGVSGKLPNEFTQQSGKVVTDLFNKKYIPTEDDDVMVKMKYVTFEQKNYSPLASTPTDMVQEKIVIKREQPISELMRQIEVILDKLPEDRKRPLDHYYPLDYDTDAPAVEDPRSDDGQKPTPPSEVQLTASGTKPKVSFVASTSKDVVGYRIYRAENRGEFKKTKMVVLTGQKTEFSDQVSPGSIYGYYITAVDVVGKESAPSKAVYTDGSTSDMTMLPAFDTGTSIKPNSADNPEQTASPNDVPSTPTRMSIHAKGMGISISWTANPKSENVTQYNVYYSDKENGTFRRLTSTSTTTFNYYAVLYDGWYQVAAVNKHGSSKPSKPIHYKHTAEDDN